MSHSFAFKGLGRTGCRGVLRSELGNMIFAFSLLYCLQLGPSGVIFESNSAKHVHWFFNSKCPPPSKYYNIWDDNMSFQQVLSFSLQHSYRESNFVVDCLAKAGG